MDECEAGAYATYVLAGIERLREECGEFLDTAMNNGSDSLADAIMNSVDWDDLMSDLREYYESNHSIVACDKCNTIRIGEVDECVACKPKDEKMWCHMCKKTLEENITNWSFPCRKCDECKPKDEGVACK